MQVDAKLSSDPSLHKQTDLPSPLGNHVVDELDFMSANELEDVAGRLGLDDRAEYVVSAEQRGAMHLDSDHDDDFEEVAVVNRRYCDSVVRSNCRVPIDTAISLLEREIGSAVETRGHLATSYGTANRQPSRQSNPAHLCAALAVIRHIRTNVMVLNTSAIEKYEAAFAQYMDDATDPAHELTEVLAHCPRTCCGKNAMRGFVLKQFPFPSAIAPGPGSWKSWRLLSAGRWAGPVSNWNPAAAVFFRGLGPHPPRSPFFLRLAPRPHPPRSPFFVRPLPFYPRS